jgi:hypothetical protein
MWLEDIVIKNGGFDLQSDRLVIDLDRGGRCGISNDGDESHGELNVLIEAVFSRLCSSD